MFSQQEEIIAEIRNKLQGSRTVLDLLKDDSKVSPEFIDIAIKDLDEAVKLLKKLNSV